MPPPGGSLIFHGIRSPEAVHEDTETNRVELPLIILKSANRQLGGQAVDDEEKPVANARVMMYGKGQRYNSTQTDDRGRYTFDQVCEGPVSVSARYREAFGNTQGQAGDTNLMVVLRNQSRRSRAISPQPIALKGKILPDLSGAGFPNDAITAGKPVLLCLFDLEQRPSRRCLRLLAEKHEALRQQGVTILAVHTSATTDEAFKSWKEANPLPFPMGYVRDKSEKNRWLTGASSLPWLILTEASHRVTAEGFALDDLDATLKTLP